MDEKGYLVLEKFIYPEEAAMYAEMLRRDPYAKFVQERGGIGLCKGFYHVPFCNILLGMFCDRISKFCGKTLIPTYSYARIYTKGCGLPEHKDRPSCEYSMTLNLAQSHPWWISMEGTRYFQKPGDAVIYKGCDVLHGRPTFEGDEYIQVFLHYVDANGPHTEYRFDFSGYSMHNPVENNKTYNLSEWKPTYLLKGQPEENE
jgi:hypothetical protein